MCTGANRIMTWTANDVSTVNPYPDMTIQCKGWAGGGWGVQRAFEYNHAAFHGSSYPKSGIKNCQATDPFTATREHMYMANGKCYTGYFDCHQCVPPPPPTPAPTPYPGTEKLEQIIVEQGGGENTTVILASIALTLVICVLCLICCAIAAWRKREKKMSAAKSAPPSANNPAVCVICDRQLTPAALSKAASSKRIV